jgi:hypothetical protein
MPKEYSGAKTLLCLECKRKYSLLDVSSYLYFAKTHTCYDCYATLRKKPLSESCFGKEQNGEGFAFDQETPECSMFCRDRFMCPQFISGEIDLAMELATEHRQLVIDRLKSERVLSDREKRTAKWQATPYRKGTILEAIFKKCHAGTTYKKLNKYMDAIGVDDHRRYMGQLRREDANGFTWRFTDDEEGNIKIEYDGK